MQVTALNGREQIYITAGFNRWTHVKQAAPTAMTPPGAEGVYWRVSGQQLVSAQYILSVCTRRVRQSISCYGALHRSPASKCIWSCKPAYEAQASACVVLQLSIICKTAAHTSLSLVPHSHYTCIDSCILLTLATFPFSGHPERSKGCLSDGPGVQ